MNDPRNNQDNLHGAYRRRTWMIIGAAAAVVALGSAIIISNIGGDDGEHAAGQPLELSLGDGIATSSCMPFEVALLAEMSPAFAATATSVQGDTVTLAVDRWYTGGDATTVVLHAPLSTQASIDGFDFEIGQHYLITAAEGNVNFCGFSGISTPELSAAFDAAFGG